MKLRLQSCVGCLRFQATPKPPARSSSPPTACWAPPRPAATPSSPTPSSVPATGEDSPSPSATTPPTAPTSVNACATTGPARNGDHVPLGGLSAEYQVMHGEAPGLRARVKLVARAANETAAETAGAAHPLVCRCRPSLRRRAGRPAARTGAPRGRRDPTGGRPGACRGRRGRRPLRPLWPLPPLAPARRSPLLPCPRTARDPAWTNRIVRPWWCGRSPAAAALAPLKAELATATATYRSPRRRQAHPNGRGSGATVDRRHTLIQPPPDGPQQCVPQDRCPSG